MADDRATFYATHYDLLGSWLLRPGDKVIVGDKRKPRTCRFCGKGAPEVKFRKVAHAIPEALGNKSIQSAYECDTCNEFFGKGIENHLGNWSKPMRTFARIRGNSSVPTLKKGLTLLPDVEVENFPHLIAWVRDGDHSRQFAEKCPIIYSFQPGPMPNDLIAAFMLRRKPQVKGYPYAFLVLGYGNEVFQVSLPSQKHDVAINGQSVSIPPFPIPGSPDPARFGTAGRALLDFTGRETVRGEIVPIVVGYE